MKYPKRLKKVVPHKRYYAKKAVKSHLPSEGPTAQKSPSVLASEALGRMGNYES